MAFKSFSGLSACDENPRAAPINSPHLLIYPLTHSHTVSHYYILHYTASLFCHSHPHSFKALSVVLEFKRNNCPTFERIQNYFFFFMFYISIFLVSAFRKHFLPFPAVSPFQTTLLSKTDCSPFSSPLFCRSMKTDYVCNCSPNVLQASCFSAKC